MDNRTNSGLFGIFELDFYKFIQMICFSSPDLLEFPGTIV